MIRAARDDDWPLIFPFFTQIVAEGKTYAYPENLDPEEARGLWMESPPGRTVVAVDDEIILGSAKMGPNRPGRGSHVATASFMADPRYRGRGVGRMLGVHVIDWARSQGYRSIQFNAVVETNEPAVALWHSLGFRTLTTVPEAFDHPDHGLVGLQVMFLDLSCPGPGADPADPKP